jgi:hypothetical protein
MRLSGQHRRIQQDALIGELQRAVGMRIIEGDPEVGELQLTPFNEGVRCSFQGGERSARVCPYDEQVGGQCDGTECLAFKLATRC